MLGVAIDEDAARNRKDHGPDNPALPRKLALSLLRLKPDNRSIRGKIKRAGWDDAFLSPRSAKCDSPALRGMGVKN